MVRLLTPSCEDVSALISLSLDQTLPRSQRFAVRIHLLYCKACRRFRQQARFLRAAARRYVSQAGMTDGTAPASLSPEARARLQRALSEK